MIGLLLSKIPFKACLAGNTGFLFLAFALIFPAMLSAAEIENPGMVNVKMADFIEHEHLIGSYPVTFLATAEHLRIDDTANKQDFILFDRKARVIYSVSSEDQQIIKIRHRPVTRQPPITLSVETRQLQDAAQAPAIAGNKPLHFQTFVNGELCYDWFAVSGLMPDLVAAMKAMKQVLAGQQAEVMQFLPADMHEACDLAENTFYPALYLDKGFPVIEQGSNGYSRRLTSFKETSVPAELFQLPQSYRIVEIN